MIHHPKATSWLRLCEREKGRERECMARISGLISRERNSFVVVVVVVVVVDDDDDDDDDGSISGTPLYGCIYVPLVTLLRHQTPVYGCILLPVIDGLIVPESDPVRSIGCSASIFDILILSAAPPHTPNL
jgi:hypothetical protein